MLAVSCEGAGWISPSPERSLSFSLEDWVDICIKHYEQEVIIKKIKDQMKMKNHSQ